MMPGVLVNFIKLQEICRTLYLIGGGAMQCDPAAFLSDCGFICSYPERANHQMLPATLVLQQ